MASLSFGLWLTENKLVPVNNRHSKNRPYYSMDVKDDEFVHFTTLDRARQILKAGRLSFRPPYKKFGTDTVDAISLVYGHYVPGTQLDHIKGQPIVAIRFKTNAIPDVGYSEEVKWLSDVPFTSVSLMSKGAAIRLLQWTPERINDDAYVAYIDHDDLDKAIGVPRSDFNRWYDAKTDYFQKLNNPIYL